jgi:hypothetical protein
LLKHHRNLEKLLHCYYINLHIGLVQTLFLIYLIRIIIVWKYVDIVVDVLILKNKFFNLYIYIFHGLCLLKILRRIFYAFDLLNVYDAIDWSHILFYQKLNKWVVIIVANFY